MYQAHFGLICLPFRLTPDPGFYFESEQFKAAGSMLADALARGEPWVVLVGDTGTGKTTLVRHFVDSLDHVRYAIGEIGSSRLEGDDLLQRIADAFALPFTEAGDPQGRITRWLQELGTHRQEALLVIDEAQALPLANLRLLDALCRLRVDGRGVLHVFLVGQNEPWAAHDAARTGPPIDTGPVCQLRPMDRAETRRYILHRLKTAGWTGVPAFPEAATDEIHERCEGVPRRINVLCDRILLRLFIDNHEDISVEVVQTLHDLLRSEISGEAVGPSFPLLGAHVAVDGEDRPATEDAADAAAMAMAVAMAMPAAPEPRTAEPHPPAPWSAGPVALRPAAPVAPMFRSEAVPPATAEEGQASRSLKFSPWMARAGDDAPGAPAAVGRAARRSRPTRARWLGLLVPVVVLAAAGAAWHAREDTGPAGPAARPAVPPTRHTAQGTVKDQSAAVQPVAPAPAKPVQPAVVQPTAPVVTPSAAPVVAQSSAAPASAATAVANVPAAVVPPATVPAAAPLAEERTAGPSPDVRPATRPASVPAAQHRAATEPEAAAQAAPARSAGQTTPCTAAADVMGLCNGTAAPARAPSPSPSPTPAATPDCDAGRRALGLCETH